AAFRNSSQHLTTHNELFATRARRSYVVTRCSTSNCGDSAGLKERTVPGTTETAKGKAIYTARTRTTGGREHGVARSCDGHLDVKLASPGSPRIGTQPDKLFPAALPACFVTSIPLAARTSKLT